MVVNFSAPVCFSEATVASNEIVLLYALFLSLAFISVLALRKTEKQTDAKGVIRHKGKITLVYMHMIFLFMPIVLLSTNTACGMTCSSCQNNLPVLMLYAVPITAAAAAFFGFVGIPFYYTFSSQRIRAKWVNDFVKTHSAKLNIRTDIRLLDSAKPQAFSFRSLRSGIFLSVGMMDILTRKEIEAVLLHELAHIKRYASAGKLSQKLMLFSPFYKLVGFGNSNKAEEELADKFAISAQGTSMHIESARGKLDEFY